MGRQQPISQGYFKDRPGNVCSSCPWSEWRWWLIIYSTLQDTRRCL
ncbi:rCG51281 [Rattus norvegicus]|uniref:RCG51281 n=1 Tax=Rattus norvegicus TaxID=10116 RepID=A6IZW4_RAT|nr:rCG51281 [Rattus norvegicus]